MKQMFIECCCCVLLKITLEQFTLSLWSAHVLHTTTTSWSVIMQAWTFHVHEDNILFVRACYERIHPVRSNFPHNNRTTLPFFPRIGTRIFLIGNKPNISQVLFLMNGPRVFEFSARYLCAYGVKIYFSSTYSAQ